MQRNFTELFYGLVDTQWAKEAPKGLLEGSSTRQGALGDPGMPRWVVPTSVASRTTYLLYKYHKITETLGDSMKINSSRRKFQKH